MVVLFVFADTKIKGFETHAQNACLSFHFSDDADELEHNLVPVSSPLSPLAPVSLHLLPPSLPSISSSSSQICCVLTCPCSHLSLSASPEPPEEKKIEKMYLYTQLNQQPIW